MKKVIIVIIFFLCIEYFMWETLNFLELHTFSLTSIKQISNYV